MSAAAYLNPFLNSGKVTAGRVDQGQDFTLSPGAPIGAIGRAKILQVQSNWYAGQPAIFYELLDGPRKGEVYYLAEQITPVVAAGQEVQAGQTIAHYASSGTGIEYGIGTAKGQTLAQATTGYTEGQATPAGQTFEKQLGEVGGASPSKHTGSCVFRDLGIPGSSVLCKPGELAQEGAESAYNAVNGAIEEGAGALGKSVGEGIINWVKPEATKIALYGVLIFGAVGMMIFGLSELLRPVGGPDVRGSIGKLAAGAVAA